LGEFCGRKYIKNKKAPLFFLEKISKEEQRRSAAFLFPVLLLYCFTA